MKAFPNPNRDKHPDVTLNSEGMDLRDYFAAKAMQAMISKGRPISEDGDWGEKKSPDEIKQIYKNIAHSSYVMADIMMEVRK